MTIKRICLKPTDPENYGEEFNLTIDLMLTDDGSPTRKMSSFGCFGGVSGKGEAEPFVLLTDGQLDFGAFYEAERFTVSNLMSGRAFLPGEYFTVQYDGEDVTYRVLKVIDLA